MAGLIVLAVIAIVVLFVLARTVRIVPQARAGIVERLGRYSRTLDAGLAIIVPFVDRLRPLIDLREQVVSFPPQPVITEDNLVVNIDTVIYFQVTDAKSATYEIADYIGAIEQLTVTTLRNVIGGMTLEDTLTSRDQINAALRTVLDEATGKWGIRVNRVDRKSTRLNSSHLVNSYAVFCLQKKKCFLPGSRPECLCCDRDLFPWDHMPPLHQIA